MGQKIVVTANVKAQSTDTEQLTAPKVSYQWHWRRILLAGGVLTILSVAAIQGTLSVVNANEANTNDPEATVDDSFVAKAVTQTVDDTVDHSTIESERVVEQGAEVTLPSAEQTILAKVMDEPNEVVIEVPQENELHQNQTQTAHLIVAELSPISRGVSIDTSVVSRAVLTRSVQEREPIDVLPSEVYTDEFEEKLYFFTELNNFTPQQVTHVWQYNGKTMAEIPLDISSNHFRTFSSKNIMNTLTGDWTVQLRDSEQKVLAEKSFRIINKQRNL